MRAKNQRQNQTFLGTFHTGGTQEMHINFT